MFFSVPENKSKTKQAALQLLLPRGHFIEYTFHLPAVRQNLFVVQTSFTLLSSMILMPQPPECWGDSSATRFPSQPMLQSPNKQQTC